MLEVKFLVIVSIFITSLYLLVRHLLVNSKLRHSLFAWIFYESFDYEEKDRLDRELKENKGEIIKFSIILTISIILAIISF